MAEALGRLFSRYYWVFYWDYKLVKILSQVSIKLINLIKVQTLTNKNYD